MIRFGYNVRGQISERAAAEVGARALALHADVYVAEHTFRGRHDGYQAQATVKGERYEAVSRSTVAEALDAALDEVQASLDLIPAWTEADVERLKERIRG